MPTRSSPETAKPRALLVVGPHRSGTSAFTRVLNLLGAELGGDLMSARAGVNDRGFWESQTIVDLHDRLLGLIGSRWDDAQPLHPGWMTRADVARVRDTIRDHVAEHFSDTPLFAVKDPRLCRLLPLWLDILNELRWPALHVIVVRNPQDVAASLEQRDGLEAGPSRLMWLDHILAAERHSRGRDRVFVRYEALLEDWSGEVQRIAALLDRDWPRAATDASDEIVDFVAADMRHHRTSDEAFLEDASWPEAARSVYSAMRAAATGAPPEDLERVCDRAAESVVAGSLFFAPVHARMRAELMEREAEIDALRESLRLQEVDLTLERRRLAEANERAESMRSEFDEQVQRNEARFEGALNDVDRARGEAEHARSWALGQQAEIERIRGIVEVRNERIEGLQHELGRRGGEALSRVAELNAANQALLHVREAAEISAEALEEATARNAVHEVELSELRTELAKSDAALQVSRAELGGVYASATYRMTDPLRRLWHRLRGARSSATAGAGVAPSPGGGPAAAASPDEAAIADATPAASLPRPLSAVAERPNEVLVEVPRSDQPRVSIVIPVFEHLDYTLACLRAVATASPEIPFEVLVVDDASGDDTRSLESMTRGVRVLRSEVNRGFVHSCNTGAAAACGEFLVFLNSDTEVEPGWLAALLTVFERKPDAGIVGAKLLDMHGALQEAGCIVWQDASGWQYGRGDDHGRPRYNALREVDYCSGACLAIPRAFFEELGGFDVRYAPAYYEDVDLCFAARAAGKRVYYQPFAVVRHHEGVSCGTDVAVGVKQFQVRNQEIFARKWREALSLQPSRDVTVERARRHGCRRRVLVVDARTPIPDNDAGSLRMFRMLQILSEIGCDVTFTAEIPFFVEEGTRRLQSDGVEVEYPHGGVASLEQILRTRGPEFDVVILSRFYVARNWAAMVRENCPQALMVLDTVDLHFVRERREADIQGVDERREVLVHARYEELAAVAEADLTLVVSHEEKSVLAEETPAARVEVVPTIHDLHRDGPGFAEREGILFIGNFQHTPNVDAMVWYLESIHEHVREALPGVELRIIGANAPESLMALEREGVRFLGAVGELEPFFDAARLSVAPLRFGAGVKGKINTSMSLGLPVVTTPVGGEGLGAAHDDTLLIADDAEAFAAEVIRLYRDEALWGRLREAGFEGVDERFSFGLAEAALRRVIGLDSEGGRSEIGPMTEAQRRLHREVEFYQDVEEVHDLPPIYHYWSNRYVLPILQACGIRGVDELFLDPIAAACRRGQGEVRIASLGAGNGDLEVRMAERLRSDGFDSFHFDCFELNPMMIARGRALAEDKGLTEWLTFHSVELSEWKAERAYAVCMAHQSLHHFTCLEHLFDEVARAIGDEGVFVTSDMIGRNGHMLWPESLAIVESLWREMPDRYKFNHALRRFEAEYDNWDCSREHNEGIRAEEILPLLMDRFAFEVFCPFSNFTDKIVGRAFGPNFDVDREDDRAFVDRVAQLDEEKIDAGELKPTHLMAVMRCSPVSEVRHYRHWTPEFCVRRPDSVSDPE